jgi:hypothetical protein
MKSLSSTDVMQLTRALGEMLCCLHLAAVLRGDDSNNHLDPSFLACSRGLLMLESSSNPNLYSTNF